MIGLDSFLGNIVQEKRDRERPKRSFLDQIKEKFEPYIKRGSKLEHSTEIIVDSSTETYLGLIYYMYFTLFNRCVIVSSTFIRWRYW